MRRLLRRLLQRFSGRRTVAAGPEPALDAAARRRHALRVRDETLARVTFGVG